MTTLRLWFTAAAFCVAPAITLVDRSIIQNASGAKPLGQALKDGLKVCTSNTVESFVAVRLVAEKQIGPFYNCRSDAGNAYSRCAVYLFHAVLCSNMMYACVPTCVYLKCTVV